MDSEYIAEFQASSNQPEARQAMKDNAGVGWLPQPTDPNPFWSINFKRELAIGRLELFGTADGYVSYYQVWFLVPRTDNRLWYPILNYQTDYLSPIKVNHSNFSYFCPNLISDSGIFRSS